MTDGSGRERLVQEGLDHLQRAARETISAMRALLDAAEELVEDPRRAETLAATLGSLAEAAVRSNPLRGMFGARPSTAGEADDDHPDDRADGDDDGGVQRIPVT